MKKVLINVEDRELRVAILEDDQLHELYIESLDDKTILNNIYKGRIEGIIPGLKAVFVNIGFERNAFLHFDDIRPDLLMPYKPETAPETAEKASRDETAALQGGEYQPTQEELEVVAEMTAPEENAAAEEIIANQGEMAPEQAAEQQPARKRRRRGRRGGRRVAAAAAAAAAATDGATEASPSGEAAMPPQDQQPVLEQAPPDEEQPPQIEASYQLQQPQGRQQGKQHQQQRQRRDRFQPQKPMAAIAPNLLPPTYQRGAHGTRAVTNPYDVYTPYSTPPAAGRQRRYGKQQNQWMPTPGSLPDNIDPALDSQEDFFPPPNPNEIQPAGCHPDDHQPGFAHGNEMPDGYIDEEYEGPAPGNEKERYLTQQPAPKSRSDGHGKQRKRHHRRNRNRNRSMRRRGPAYYAVRRKEPAEEQSEKNAKKTRSSSPKKASSETDSPKTLKAAKTKAAKKPAASAAAPKQKAATATHDAVPPPATAEKTTAEPAPQTSRRRKKEPETKTPPSVQPAEIVAQPEPVQATPADSVAHASEAVPMVEPTEEKAGATPPPAAPKRRTARKTAVRAAEAPAIETTPPPEYAEADMKAPPETQEPSPVAAAQPATPPSPARVQKPPQPPRRRGGRHPQRPSQQRPPQQRHERPRPMPVPEALKKGDEIMIQVIKEEIGLKGARISTYLSIPGRYLVLLPHAEEGGVSRKVENIYERKRLKHLLHEIRQDLDADNVGFIVRTAGVDREESEIRNDVEFLLGEWNRAKSNYTQCQPTKIVYDDSDILYRLARDVFDENISEILIDSPAEAEHLKSILGKLIPGLVDKVKLYNEPENLFHRYQVEKQIQKAGRRKVWLKSGGYIIIDEAEALTAIDVNTGKFIGKDDQEKMILKTNMEAARTISRELKLRDIGGLIVIDFIDMRDPRNRETLLNEFRNYLKRDRSKTSVSDISEFGLVEMTRKRVRKSLRKTIFTDCPYCQGAGVVLNEQQIWLHIKHEITRLLEDPNPPAALNIVVNPKIRAHIDQNYRDALKRFEQKYGVEIKIGMNDVFHVEVYAIDKIARDDASKVEQSAVDEQGN
ncbi:MAG: Rne/Rng family ribonuclease [bacterium]